MSDGFWRVYAAEWCVAYVSDADGEAGRQECAARFQAEFKDLVPEQARREVPWSKKDPEVWPWMLELHIPVLKGEHVHQEDADEHARIGGGTVVRENSPEDKIMRAIGKWNCG